MVAEWGAAQADSGHTVWEPLKAYPLQSWLRARWAEAVERGLLLPLAVTTSLQEQQLWQQVIAEHAVQTNAVPLLRVQAAAELAAQARQRLLRWQVKTNEPRICQLFELESDCLVFFEWLQRFNDRLDSSGLCTPDDCLAQLVSLAEYPALSRVTLVECEEPCAAGETVPGIARRAKFSRCLFWQTQQSVVCTPIRTAGPS